MNDYKELIEMLRHQVINDDDASEIADAIEQLVADNESYKCALADLHNEIANYCETIATLEKERDAAVADLRNVIADDFSLSQCHYCKYQEEDGQCHHDCIMFSPKWGWEWRGVKEDNR